VYTWQSKWITGYQLSKGISVTPDGRYLYAQSWDNGLHCLDARTGSVIWKTKSKRGITNIFVCEQFLLCHQHDRALQWLDILTGEVVKEKRSTAWGFTALDSKSIVCQVSSNRWEVIDAQTMEIKESYSHKIFTGGHMDYCINKIQRTQNGKIQVFGFKSIWDHSVKPPIRLPNLEFEHILP
jgi:hypothetical protein